MIVLICLVAFLAFKLPSDSSLIAWYDTNIFYPLQSLRGMVFGKLPFSIGDAVYVAAGVALLVLLIRWIYFLLHLSQYKRQLGHSVLRNINRALAIYLLFLLGWGANYYKPALAESWGLEDPINRETDSIQLVTFNRFLAEKLNAYAPAYRHMGAERVNEKARVYYLAYTDCKVGPRGLDIKPTAFRYFMERLAIEGYYNPFTGEGQINEALPGFLLPFITCHEMAHQAGIAAEGDANLMAYALTSITGDSSFGYSGYLNIWLYAHNRLYRRDTGLAGQTARLLNPLTLAHIDTLRQLSKKYQNKMARYSSELFDQYLRMQNQQEGIKSYGNVTYSAWQLEQQRAGGSYKKIIIP
jgi:hypothetical protein